MKKSFLFLVLFLVPFVIHAQGIGIGIKAGANFANQDVTDIDIKTATDYHVGGICQYQFLRQMGYNP